MSSIIKEFSVLQPYDRHTCVVHTITRTPKQGQVFDIGVILKELVHLTSLQYLIAYACNSLIKLLVMTNSPNNCSPTINLANCCIDLSDTANVMDLTFNAREKTPDGSLVSLVCGNPASDMDSHRPADSDIDHIPTYSRQEERIDTVTKRDSPQKQCMIQLYNSSTAA